MPDKVIYYAVIDERSSRERPAGLFRRTYTEVGGKRDEAFTRDLIWKRSPSLVSAEHLTLQGNKIIVAGHDTSGAVVLERFKADGSLDASFGVGASHSVSTGLDQAGEDVGALVAEHSRRAEDEVKAHYNFDLGLPYSPKGGSLSREQVMAVLDFANHQLIECASSLTNA